MSALACLRVVVEGELVALPEATLGSLVRKLTGAYLETRWLLPRTFVPLTNYAFLLTDPRADKMDIKELARLSQELQIKLFGQTGSGKVALLLLEGPEPSLHEFAQFDAAALARARADPTWLPPGTRLAQLLSEGLVAEAEGPAPPKPAAAEPLPPPTLHTQLHGVYFRMRSVFIGDVVSACPEGGARATLVEGPNSLPRDPEAFDAACLEAAVQLLARPNIRSTLYIPLSYDSLVRPSRLTATKERLQRLPTERRAQLASLVYGVPRDPPFGAVTQIRAALAEGFNSIDLRVEDPDFQIDKLAPNAVTGVSLALPAGDRRTRLAALKHFTEHRLAYKQRRIWASVTNVRDATELDACEALGVPFVTGPAVCEPQPNPLGGRVVPREALPLRCQPEAA